MFPVLLSFRPVTIYTIGLFLVIAFLTSGYIFWRKGREEHYQEEELFDAFLLTGIWGLLWSRIGFVVLHFNNFGLAPLKWIDIFNNPGTYPFLGVVMGGWFLYNQAKKKKWDEFEILDFASLALAISLVIVSIGSFFDGSGIGNPTSMPWGVTFPAVFDKRHPTQLYGAAFYLALYVYLNWLEPRYRMFEWYRNKKHSAPTGFLFAIFCIGYGLYGMILSFLSPASVTFFQVNIDLPLRFAIFLFGIFRLFIQSGRGIMLPKRSRPPVVAEVEEKSDKLVATP